RAVRSAPFPNRRRVLAARTRTGFTLPSTGRERLGLGTPPAVHAAVMTNDSAIILPPRWRCTTDPERGVVVVARQASVPPSGVPPEVVLCRTRVDGTLASWRAQALAGLAERLHGFDLEDEDEIELDGREVAYRRFAHRVGLAA